MIQTNYEMVEDIGNFSAVSDDKKQLTQAESTAQVVVSILIAKEIFDTNRESTPC